MQTCPIHRTADPRVYATSAKQSIQPSKYVINAVAFSHCKTIKDITDEVDKPYSFKDECTERVKSACDWLPCEDNNFPMDQS